MIKLLLPHVLIAIVKKLWRKNKLEKRILSLRKEVAAILTDTSISEDMRKALVVDLRKRISALESELN